MQETSSQLVYSVKTFQKTNSDKIVFFFCPFGFKSWILALPGLPIWRLLRKGYSVISYSYSTDIATKSLEMTITNLESIIADANAKIATFPETTEIICFGTSMGTVLATNVAAQHAQIKKVILNLSYSDISDHIISLPGIRTIPTKKLSQYITAAGGKDNLRAAFDPFSPINLVHNLKDKHLLLYLSQNDNILKLMHTKNLHNALIEAEIDLQYYENKSGRHYFAALYNYLRYSRWMRFLQQ